MGIDLVVSTLALDGGRHLQVGTKHCRNLLLRDNFPERLATARPPEHLTLRIRFLYLHFAQKCGLGRCRGCCDGQYR